MPKRIALDGIARFEGTQLFYHPESLDGFSGRTAVVNGGDDSALETALALTGIARQVTLLHRRDGFQADEALVARMRAAVADKRMAFVVGQPSAFFVAAMVAIFDGFWWLVVFPAIRQVKAVGY